MLKIYRPISFFCFCLFFLFINHKLWATHNRAGEISIEQIGDCNDLTIRATVTTYTKESSTQADRDSVTICWGDGICELVARQNGVGSPPQGVSLGNDIKFNTYIAEHNYPGRGTYCISMNDPNRNGGILNVNWPNSEAIPFHIQTIYTFLNPQFQGCNNTPRLLQPPIDVGCVGQPFIHNPNAYDIDGDSLSYHLIVPMQTKNTPVVNYLFPDMIEAGLNNNLSIDEVTGDIVWDAPQRAGEYNLAMIIVEHRNGIPIDTMIRDMQITIEMCENLPPEVELPFDEICVVAGELLEFDVVATAPLIEAEQEVALTARGGPFAVLYNRAEFEAPAGFNPQPVRGRFRWQTSCEHISDQHYSIVFRAVDNFLGDTLGLATLKTMRVKVVGPPPLDVQAEAGSGEVLVSWESPYFCENAEDDYFQGFSVWRREGTNQFMPDSCTPGLAGRGYTEVAFNIRALNASGRYEFLDNQVERGRTYCYRILGEFARSSPNGNYLYNRVESLPSDEICVQLSRDIPLLTHVDVKSTSSDNGSIEVRWTKPKAGDLDTLLNPGPYRYRLLRATAIDGTDFQAVPGADFTYEFFALANDTSFLDMGLNTVANGYNYQLEFYVAGQAEPLGITRAASSVFLTVAATDEVNNLSWQEIVPWDNFEYAVFWFDPDLNDFVLLDTVSEQNYAHKGLINGIEYCYKVESIGSYGVSGLVNVLHNFSQEACATPLDTIAPCPPVLEVHNVCEEAGVFVAEDQFENNLLWTHPMSICPEVDDVFGYSVYYSPAEGGDFVLIESIEFGQDTFYTDRPELGIAGCYAVTAIDSLGNESAFSNIVCVDNCPSYQLPNTFTPNGDGQNELFIPYPFRFIESVEFKVFNRWGNLIFETTDPQLNWNGTNLSGKEVASGVYFYSCKVFERRVNGILQSPELLKGYIEVLR